MAGQISKITQIGMVTADLDKMVKYYEEMLGLVHGLLWLIQKKASELRLQTRK